MISTASLDHRLPRRDRLVLLVLVIVFVLIVVLASIRTSLTIDESLHYHYGLFVLQGNSDRIDDSSMPISAINALPTYAASHLPDGLLRETLAKPFLARLVTILFAAWIASVVFRWAHALYGLAPATLTTLLYILDPNIIAHSQLITTDVFAAGAFTVALYCTWRYARTRRWQDGLLCSVAIGASQLVKYTAVALVPLCLLALVVHDWPSISAAIQHRRAGAAARHTLRLAGVLLAWLVAATVVVNLGFLGNRTLSTLEDYRFRSETFRQLKTSLTEFQTIRIPLPYPYLEGLDWMRHTEQTASRYGNVYLLGHLSKPSGFPGYYLVASALKVPIATQVFFLAALAVFTLDRNRWAHFAREEAFLLLPAAALAFYFNFLFNAQTGMRYYLVIFPLLYVFSGSFFVRWSHFRGGAKLASIGLLAYLVLSVLSYFPYFTPYFNELVWDKTQAYRFLADSNLEWGQSRNDLQQYLLENPDAILNPAKPLAGHVVVGGSDLVGILEDPARYAWLRNNFEPADTIAFGYFIYRISSEDLERTCLGTPYCE